ncbi:T9SS type A sorting domain-containing protein [Flavitalea flava]
MIAKIYIPIIAILSWLLPRTASAQGLIIPSSAYVIAGNGNIVTAANWTNNGSFTHSGGTVIFAGATQTLAGSSPTLFNNLSVSAGSNTSITATAQTLRGTLLSNGTLNANGNLTLLSTASQTALVDGSGTGEVLGNLSMQRYLPTGFGYKYFSSPFQADTIGDFSQEINLGTAFPDVYKYDESLASNGWVTYTSGSGLLIPLIGYAVNFGTAMTPLTVSLTGVVNNHTISLPTLYNHNNTYTLGFNLVGNPYPSPVNWDAVGGWTKTNIDNAIYFFSAGTTNQYTGTYSSYVNGVSSNGIAGNIISSMQGFFIHVSNGTYPVAGTLAVNNTARSLNPSTIFFGISIPDGPRPLLRISAGFADEQTVADPLVFYFKQQATDAFDRKLDALKMMNTHLDVPNLYAVSQDLAKLSIYALSNTIDSSKIIPLGLKTAKDGFITFKTQEIANMPGGLYIYLSDTKTGTLQDLSKGAPYRLFLSSGEYTNRFFLNFSTKELTSSTTSGNELFTVYSSGNNLIVNSNLMAGEKGNLILVNILGQVVRRDEIIGNGSHIIPISFIPGVYVVCLQVNNKVQSKKVFIGSP